MTDDKPLWGKRIAVLAADGFEKAELVIPCKALHHAGAKAEIVSLRRGKIRGVNLHEPDGTVPVAKTIRQADPAHYHGLLLPGGFISPDLLRQSAEARAFVRSFDATRKPIATLCHGPWVLASAGLLAGRTITSWPGIRDDVVNAGATWLDQDLVRDGNLITSRGPQDIVQFVKGMLELFAESAPIQNAKAAYTRSSPQRNEPPPAVLSVIGAHDKPSISTLLGAGALAWGLVAAFRRTSL